MEEVLIAHRPDFAVTEEPCQSSWTDLLLDVPGIMVLFAEQTVPPPIATAKTRAINGAALNLVTELLQQHGHILSARRGIASLELNGLTRSRVSSHSERA